jgi:hypothetical protein
MCIRGIQFDHLSQAIRHDRDDPNSVWIKGRRGISPGRASDSVNIIVRLDPAIPPHSGV